MVLSPPPPPRTKAPHPAGLLQLCASGSARSQRDTGSWHTFPSGSNTPSGAGSYQGRGRKQNAVAIHAFRTLSSSQLQNGQSRPQSGLGESMRPQEAAVESWEGGRQTGQSPGGITLSSSLAPPEVSLDGIWRDARQNQASRIGDSKGDIRLGPGKAVKAHETRQVGSDKASRYMLSRLKGGPAPGLCTGRGCKPEVANPLRLTGGSPSDLASISTAIRMILTGPFNSSRSASSQSCQPNPHFHMWLQENE